MRAVSTKTFFMLFNFILIFYKGFEKGQQKTFFKISRTRGSENRSHLNSNVGGQFCEFIKIP